MPQEPISQLQHGKHILLVLLLYLCPQVRHQGNVSETKKKKKSHTNN